MPTRSPVSIATQPCSGRWIPVIAFTLSWMTLAGVASSQENLELRPGDPAPSLELEKLLQAPEGAVASWEALRGKVVVLDFWATWCAPCIGAIPHLNELAEDFEDEVQFIAITDEDEAKFAPLLRRRPMKGWVAVDPYRSTIRAFGVTNIPHTVVVNREGKIAGIVNPVQLTAEALANVAAGRPQIFPERTEPIRIGVDPLEKAPGARPPLFQIAIRPTPSSVDSDSTMAVGPQGMTIFNSSITGLLGHIYRVPEARILNVDQLPDTRYTLVARAPANQRQSLYTLVNGAVEMTFGVKAHRETRATDVLVVTAPNGPGPGFKPSTGYNGVSMQPGEISLTNADLKRLLASVERRLKVALIDETKIEGLYDLRLRFDASDLKSLRSALERDFGLKLEPAVRSVAVLVVERSKQ